ncbi:branched-chain amino acid ABC transporter permease [Herbiconiux moechotypicola]|uniref:Branched-chain amino acid ABC transporter permease n=1 Tax=Herbiconiux moechotypicola TaxID=637393 RepID=A0ABN3DSN7_9MICO|nr:branched-chain amino acid ABC transporter permease [Herbiconiux moechotypicola]MCS5730591.1 branched-chain amino acid ABC transporter permease [Herbiconiux moechotypicola]
MIAGIRLGRATRLTTMLLAVIALCAGLVIGSGALSASASTAPAPTPTPTEEGDFTSTYTIGGILRDGDNLVAGAEVTVEGDGFTETATSDDSGRWSVAVPGRGEYTVTLDVETLPDGVELRDPDRASATVGSDEWLTNTITRSFPLGVDTRQTTGFFEQFLQRFVAGLNFGLLIALAAIGITLIFGTTGLNNFAHGEMVTFGAIVAWVTSVLLGVNIFVAMIVALILGGVFGYLNDWLLWKPLRRKGVKLVQAMIVSIGLAIALRYLYLFFIGGDTKTMNVGLSDAVVLGPVRITTGSIISMALSVIVLVLVGLFLTRTRIGKATRAVSDNPSLAAASGIDVDRIIRIVWVLAGSLAALAGVMLALYRQVSWDMGFQVLLLMFAAVTLGGLGSAYGALVGSIVVGLFVELSTLFIPPDLKYAAALVVLIVVLLVRPQGILGRKERVG